MYEFVSKYDKLRDESRTFAFPVPICRTLSKWSKTVTPEISHFHRNSCRTAKNWSRLTTVSTNFIFRLHPSRFVYRASYEIAPVVWNNSIWYLSSCATFCQVSSSLKTHFSPTIVRKIISRLSRTCNSSFQRLKYSQLSDVWRYNNNNNK